MNSTFYSSRYTVYSNWLSAFGTILDNRNFGNSPRVGFNGKEKDPETVGSNGNTYDYGFRIYNPSLGRFLSVDPLAKSYPMLTTYQFASNKPINAIDLDGLESADVYHYLDAEGKFTGTTEIKVRDKEGCLGDGILVHQLVMTSDNPGGMVQNFDYKEDFSKATYVQSTHVETNSTQTDKAIAKQEEMKQKQFEVAFPIVKGFKEFKGFLKKLDRKMEGHSDQANTGYTTEQDMKVGLGMVGAITGLGGIAAASSAIGYLGASLAFVNDADDVWAATNDKNESLSESLAKSEQSKAIVSGVKSIMTVITFSQGMAAIPEQAEDALHVIGTATDAYGTGKDVVEGAINSGNGPDKK